MLYDLTTSEYERMYFRYNKGIITEKEWTDYCFAWLNYIIKINEKVLCDLKNTY